MQTDPLSVTFSALSDPTRRAILARLAQGPASVGELAEPFDVSLPAISRHLSVLMKAGLVSQHRDAQWRRCQLAANPLRDASRWLERYRSFWERSFDALEQHLKRVPKKRSNKKGARK